MADWMKEPPKKEELGPSWMDAAPTEDEIRGHLSLDEPKASKLESGLRGAVDSASLGWADEITGGVESFLTGKPYEQARDESRANYAKAKAANPNTYLAGQLGGGLATAAIPGAGVARLGLMGAASGLGASEADNATDALIDTAKGGTVGLLTGGLGKAIPKVGSLAKGSLDDIASAPLNSSAPRGILASGLQKVHQAGAKGNAMLDKATETLVGDSPMTKVLGRGGRYLSAGKMQGALDAMEHGPKVAQMAANKASQGIDRVSDYLRQSPRFSSMSEGAFKSLAQSVSNRTAQFNPSRPVSEDEAKSAFVEGN